MKGYDHILPRGLHNGPLKTGVADGSRGLEYSACLLLHPRRMFTRARVGSSRIMLSARRRREIDSAYIAKLAIVSLLGCLCFLAFFRVALLGVAPGQMKVTYELSSSITGRLYSPSFHARAVSVQEERGSDTVVIMYDTRPPTPRSRKSSKQNEYWSLAAYLNWRFACSRGYDFLYYLEINIAMKEVKPDVQEGNSGVFKQQVTCYMDRKVGRATPW